MVKMLRIITIHIILCGFSSSAFCLDWTSLWKTKDAQARDAMKQGEFAKAAVNFKQLPWKATALYRAGNYKDAASQFGSLQTEMGYYNEGNALAKMEQYEAAIKAYDKALSFNPHNQDAIFNRKLVASLLKKNKENNKDNNQKNNKNTQKENKPDNKENQGKSNQQNSKNQQKQNQENQQNQENPPNPQNKKNEKLQNKKDEASKSKQEEKPDSQKKPATDPTQKEKEQTKKQWMQLIPDDPGGLLREKFLRDLMRRQNGESL